MLPPLPSSVWLGQPRFPFEWSRAKSRGSGVCLAGVQIPYHVADGLTFKPQCPGLENGPTNANYTDSLLPAVLCKSPDGQIIIQSTIFGD